MFYIVLFFFFLIIPEAKLFYNKFYIYLFTFITFCIVWLIFFILRKPENILLDFILFSITVIVSFIIYSIGFSEIAFCLQHEPPIKPIDLLIHREWMWARDCRIYQTQYLHEQARLMSQIDIMDNNVRADTSSHRNDLRVKHEICLANYNIQRLDGDLSELKIQKYQQMKARGITHSYAIPDDFSLEARDITREMKTYERYIDENK